jgi:hypothetical protein
MMASDLEQRFDVAMRDLSTRITSETDCDPQRLLQLVAQRGGVGAAKAIVDGSEASDIYAALARRDRLDLSVEALIFDNREFRSLFSDEEQQVVRQRLVASEYPPAIDPVEEFIGAFASDVPDWTLHVDEYLGRTLMDDHEPKAAPRG